MATTVEGLLAEARAAGARFTVSGARVRVFGVLPEALLIQLRRHREEVLDLLRGQGSSVAASGPNDPPRWTGDSEDLVCWFRSAHTEGCLPVNPFGLWRHVNVVAPATFYEALDRDIARGPRGPRATALTEELKRLREIVDEQSHGGLKDGGEAALGWLLGKTKRETEKNREEEGYSGSEGSK